MRAFLFGTITVCRHFVQNYVHVDTVVFVMCKLCVENYLCAPVVLTALVNIWAGRRREESVQRHTPPRGHQSHDGWRPFHCKIAAASLRTQHGKD